MLCHTKFFDTLAPNAAVRVWATSASRGAAKKIWESARANIESFPVAITQKEFPNTYTYVRQMNDFVWDYSKRPPSRISKMRLGVTRPRRSIRALKGPALLIALVGGAEIFESWVEQQFLKYAQSPETLERLRTNRPDVLVCSGPHRPEEPTVVAIAKSLRIPTLALITSWDNLSTKRRMIPKYDGFIVWSERMRQDLHHFYPQTHQKPTFVIGAPQFDVFVQDRFYRSREQFCAAQGLNPNLPIILYSLGSPRKFHEYHGALYLAERVLSGDLGLVQMIVRPHPLFDDDHLRNSFEKYSPLVRLQQTGIAGTHYTARSQDESQIVDWVNTFRHADVVVNLSSTVTIDAAIFDRPIVNLDFDPAPGQPNQALVKDVNHVWTHFKPIAESGGVWLVNNPEEMFEAVRSYLARPDLHREKRRWIAEYVCGYLDGKCGERMAQAILDFLHHLAKGSEITNAANPEKTRRSDLNSKR